MYIVVTLPRSYDCAATFFEDKEIALEYYIQVFASDPILARVLDVKLVADESNICPSCGHECDEAGVCWSCSVADSPG